MAKRIVLLISTLIEKTFQQGFLIDNRYEVVRLLGSGSYGHCYLVFDRERSCQVVLKTLRWHKRINKSGRAGFHHEMKILEKINHPGFPTFFESGKTGKIPFFTMEYVNGNTFEQLIFQEGKMYGEVESFTLAGKLLEIIYYIHQVDIVHRDIRIPNIMVEGEDLKVIDVGLARYVKADLKDIEQSTNHPRKQINYQSDFYGLGHFLLFLLYSSYAPANKTKERSWEEELVLSEDAKFIIRKLLQIDTPYKNSYEIQQDFRKIINLKMKG